jgi:hypothetical protein
MRVRSRGCVQARGMLGWRLMLVGGRRRTARLLS